MMMTVENDTERYRAELKQKRAALIVKRSSVREAEAIVTRLEASKDEAAAEHAEAAAKIQSELDAVDAADIDAIVRKESPSQESLDRRRELLRELSALNEALELKLEAARRSIVTVRKQVEDTRTESLQLPLVEAQLRRMCSMKTRQQLLANEFMIFALKGAIKEVRRRVSIQQDHVAIHKRNKDEGSHDGLFAAKRLDDLEFVQRDLDAKLSDAIAEQDRLQEVALSE